MFVITADQRGSTRKGVRVHDLLDSLEPWNTQWHHAIALPLSRTVGDEVQTVLTDAAAAVDLALTLARAGEWSVGIGAGAVDEPLGPTSRESEGEAFVLARRAVERAKGKGEPVPIVVAGTHSLEEEHATAVMQLLGAVVQRRSAAGWEVADLLRPDLPSPHVTQREVAARLEISTQAVSQRVASAMIDEERRARPVAATLLERASHGQSSPKEQDHR